MGSLVVRARGSCDTVTFDDAEVDRDVRIALRSEEVSVRLDYSIIRGRILYRGGPAEDHVGMDGSSIGRGTGTSVFSLGGGDDVLSAYSDFDGNVRVTGGRGWDQVDFGGSTVGGKFSAKLGNDDSLEAPEG